MKQRQLKELILQSLQQELGGVQVYETALTCAKQKDLRKEWAEYLEQTRTHVDILQNVCKELEIDPDEDSPGRTVVRHLGEALVEAMNMAKAEGEPAAAQLVACECVVLAETKDHADWELLARCAKKLKGAEKKALQEAVDKVEEDEDEHLYHTKGWCRELWLQSLGLDSVLPPPEERKNVKTAIGAARAVHASERAR